MGTKLVIKLHTICITLLIFPEVAAAAWTGAETGGGTAREVLQEWKTQVCLREKRFLCVCVCVCAARVCVWVLLR